MSVPPEPVAGFAPKGRPGVVAVPGGSYIYAELRQQVSDPSLAAGAGATMLHGDPAVSGRDFHSLAEIAVSSPDLMQVVEIGWTVDISVYHDLQPRLFVFHWVDAQPTCYDACGWVQVSTTHAPGERVDPTTSAEYTIALRGTDWWLSYRGEDLGYFPGSLWSTAPFTQVGNVSWYGEISGSSLDSCSEMGNGLRGTEPGAATMTGMYLVGAMGVHVPAAPVPGEITNANWNIMRTAGDAFAFGGRGRDTCCTPMTCSDSAAQCGRPPDACRQELVCGSCSAEETCTDSYTCVPGVPGDPSRPDDGGGCCQSGPSQGAPILGLAVLLLLRSMSRNRLWYTRRR